MNATEAQKLWAKMQVVHVCCNCGCVNPRHLIWGSNKLNASHNSNNSYQAQLNARGDGRIDIAAFGAAWTAKALAGYDVGYLTQTN